MISPHVKYCEGHTENLLKDRFKAKKRRAFSGNRETENISEGWVKKAKNINRFQMPWRMVTRKCSSLDITLALEVLKSLLA